MKSSIAASALFRRVLLLRIQAASGAAAVGFNCFCISVAIACGAAVFTVPQKRLLQLVRCRGAVAKVPVAKVRNHK